MTAPKRIATQDLQSVFAQAADEQIKRLEGRTKEDLARARRDAAAKRAADREAAAKAKLDAAFEKKILKVFKEAKKLYEAAFGVNQSFAVSIKENKIKIEHLGSTQHQARMSAAFVTQPQFSEPAYIHGAFGKIISVKDGKLSQRRWGMAVDPQERNYPLSLREEELQQALVGPVIAFGSKEDLQKLKALMSPAVQNKRTPSTPKPRR
jgi:hypothetical protein